MAGPVQRAPKGSFPWLPVVVGLVLLGYVAPKAPELARQARTLLDGRTGRELAARIARARPGEHLEIPAGRFVLPGTLRITKPLTLTGAGPDATFLMGPGDDYALVLASAGGITLERLAVARAPKSTGNLVEVPSGVATLDTVHVEGAIRSAGSRAVSWAGVGLVGGPRSEVTIRHAVFQGNRGGGLTTRGKLEAADTLFSGNGGYAFEVREKGHATATRLHLQGNQDGIHVSDASLDLTDSILETSGTAVYLGFGAHGIVRRNQILHNYAGLTVEVGSSAIVDHNRITDNEKAGIQRDPRGFGGRYGASRVTASENVLAGNGAD